MNDVYNYVMEKIEEGKGRDEIIKGVGKEFSARELYYESNLGFYFDDEETHEITAEADGSIFVICKVEKGQTLEEIKQEFIETVKYLTYNIYKNIISEPILEIGFEDIDEETRIVEYIFEEYLKKDIEYFLNEDS